MNTVALVLFVWSLITQLSGRMRHVDHLPISRHVIFAVAVVPALVLLAVGLGVGSLAPPTIDASPDPVAGCDSGGAVVVHESWEIVRAGKVPAVVAPWGESYTPVACTLWEGGSWVAYNPYSAATYSTDEFSQWQVERAAGTVDEHSRTIALMTLLAIGGLAAFCVATLRRSRPYPIGRVSAVGVLVVLAGGALLAAAIVLSEAAGIAHAMAFEMATSVPLRLLADALPLPTWSLWALVIAAGAACYAIVERAFLAVEARSAGGRAPFVGEE